VKLACTALANTCLAILRDGAEVPDGAGPLTFTSPALHEILGVDRTVDAVRRFYGRDAHVIAVSRQILDEAGYGEDVGPDPTSG
jgi:hypothetical protein